MLTGTQRKYLRGLAHQLRPHVQIGKEGLSDRVLEAIGTALDAQELLKIQIRAERDTRAEITEAIAAQMDCECVGTIGHMSVFFRQQSDPEKRLVELP